MRWSMPKLKFIPAEDKAFVSISHQRSTAVWGCSFKKQQGQKSPFSLFDIFLIILSELRKVGDKNNKGTIINNY